MNAKIIFALAFAALAAADRPNTFYGAPRVASRESYESFESTEAKYDFDWAVKHDESGNDFGQQETRDEEHTQGSYYVQLPDGRLQKVSYYVDGDSGFVADVSYEGEARYDSTESRESSSPLYSTSRPVRPVYSAPRPDSHESFERRTPSFNSHESFEVRRPVSFNSHESFEVRRPTSFNSHESFEVRRPTSFESRESFDSVEDLRRRYGF